jgi:hypothetical protein
MNCGPSKISLGGRDIPVEIAVKPVRSGYRLAMSEHGVRLVIAKSRLHEAGDILNRHSRWISGHYEKIRRNVSEIPEIADGADIPFRGGKCLLNIIGENGNAFYDGDRSLLQLYAVGNDAENIRSRLRLWYFAQSADFAKKLCLKWKVRERFGVRRIVLKDLRTRWGTCNIRDKSIILNWRLIMAPDDIFEYVLVHELAHLEVAGHGSDFWNYVEDILPDSPVKRKWLNKNGFPMLRFLGEYKLSSERIM